FYQFWINTDDRDVIKFLNYFTFLSEEEINQLQDEVTNRPGDRIAQKRLAEELTKWVHGEQELEQAKNISTSLFDGNIKQLTADEIKKGFKDVPTFELSKMDIPLIDLLVNTKISSSKRQAREDIG